MSNKKLDYLKLHISVLLSGFTGLFAMLISLNEVVIVWYRMLFAFLIFAVMLIFMKKKPDENLKDALRFLGLGALLALTQRNKTPKFKILKIKTFPFIRKVFIYVPRLFSWLFSCKFFLLNQLF